MQNPPLETTRNTSGDNLEERVRAALAHSPVVLFSQDTDLRYTWMFNAYPGFTVEEIMGRRDEDLFPPRNAARLTALKRQVLETGEGVREEVRVALRGETRDFDLTVEPLHDSAGTLIGVTGAVLDITARKRAEEGLSASEERYRSISELLFGFVYSYRVESNFKIALEWTSGHLQEITGLSEGEASAQGGWMMLIYPGDRHVLRDKVRALLAGREDVSEYRIFTREAEVRWVRDYSRPVWDAVQGRVVRIYGAAVDITERREAADALRKSEEHFRLLAENAADMIYRMSIADGRYEYVSPASVRITGYAPEEFYKNPLLIRKMIHPDFREYFDTHFNLLQNGELPASYEFRILDKSGRARWLLQRNSLVRDNADRPVAIEGIITDITDRKEAEQELQESEERFRRLSQAASEGIVVHENGIILDANESYAAMLGYTLPEIIGKPVDSFIAPEYMDIVRQHIRDQDETPYEAASVRKDGALIYQEIRGKTIPLHGRIVRVTALHDITDRKEAEEELRESERRYRSLFENMLDGLAYCQMLFDPEGRPEDFIYLEVNSSLERLTGLRDVIGKRVTEVIPGIKESNPEVFEVFGRTALTGEPERFEAFLKPLGIWMSFSVLSTKKGYFSSIFDNITDRKKAEEALRESEKRFASAFEYAAIGIALVSPEGRWRMVNHSLSDMVGYSEEELLPKTFMDITYPDDLEADLELVRRLLAGEIRTYQMEKRYIHKQGHLVWALLSVSLVRDEQNEPLYFISQLQDITERKRTEEALRESEEQYRRLFTEMTSGLAVHEIITDEKGTPVDYRFIDLNPAFERLTGLKREETVGRTLREVLPDIEPEWIDRYGKVALTGESIHFENYAAALKRWYSVIAFSPRPGQFAAMFTDITLVKEAEEELTRSEERYRRLFEDDLTGDYLATPDGEIIVCNPAFASIFGFETPRLAARANMADRYTRPEAWREFVDRLRREQKIESYESDRVRGDNSVIRVVENAGGRFDDKGVLREIYGYIFDITERTRAEEALRRERDLVNRIMETSPVGIVAADREGKITFANERSLQILGLSREEMATRNYNSPEWNITDFEGRPFPGENLPYSRISAERHAVYGIHHAITLPDGVRRLLSVNAAPLFTAEGELDGMVASITEITERIQAEEALKKAAARREATLNAIPDLLFEVDREGRIEYFHAPNPELLFLPPGEFLGRTMREVLPAEASEAVDRAIAETAEKGRSAGAVYSLEIGGEIRWFEISAGAIGDPHAPDARFILLARDITERRRAEEEYRSIFENAPLGIFRSTAEGKLTSVNPALVTMLGYDSAAELLETVNRRSIQDVLYVEPGLREGFVRKVQESGQWQRYENRYYRKDGRIIITSLYFRPYSLMGGKDEFEGFIEDITERKQAEEALRESEERFRAAFENGAIAMALTATDSKILKVNAAFCELVGYCGEELVGHSFAEFTYPEDLPLNQEKLQAVFSGEESSTRMEKRYVRKDGQIIWTDMSTASVRDARGKPLYIVTHVQDITERKRAEEALRESEQRLKFHLENSPLAVLEWDADYVVTQWSNEAERMFGWKREEALGKRIDALNIIYEKDIPILNKTMERLSGGKERTVVSTNRNYTKAGAVIECVWYNSVLLDENGRMLSVMSLVQDITERKMAEDALRESEERYRRLAEATYEGLAIHAKGEVLDVNPRFLEMLGYSREEVIGKPIRDFVAPERWRQMWKNIRSGSEAPYESRVVRKDGKVLDVEVVARNVPLHGRMVRVAALRDVTERRELEGKIARLRREYEVFMRHEVKNLLVPIEMQLERFMENPPDCLTDEHRAALRRMKECIERAERVIDALKRLQDMEAGKYILNKSRCSLNALLRATVRELRVMADRYGVTIAFPRERIATTELQLDCDLMPGVFSNLIINAIQHVADLKDPAEKTVTVKLTVENDAFVVRINNRGEPVPPERLATFFEKFNVNPRSRFGGTGLGTTYARLVVQAHEGDISVSSNAEEGTTVTVRLPVT